MPRNASPNPVAAPTAERVLQVLAVLAQQGKALSAAELMERTGLARVLVNDCASGVMRHADAGYESAVECARRFGLKLPMAL